MRIDRHKLVERVAPIGHNPISMVVRSQADALIDRAGQYALCRGAGAVPGGVTVAAIEGAVAGEGELAAGASFTALEDDAADRLGKRGMADAVEDDLTYRTLSVGVVAGLVKHRSRQTIAGAIKLGEVAVKSEWLGGNDRPGNKRNPGVYGARIVLGDRLEYKWFNGWRGGLKDI